MKKLSLLASTLAVLLGVMAAPVPASAGAGAPVPPVCHGHQLLDWAYVYALKEGKLPWGITDLCWDGSKAFTMYSRLNANNVPEPMPINFYANAWVYRYDPWLVYDGRSSCDGPDGNGHVVPGEIWCRSHGLAPLSSSTWFRGTTFVYQWNGSTWVHVARGWTPHVCNASRICHRV